MHTNTNQKYIQHKQLFISENDNNIIYLGYELKLTKTEYQILKTLAKSNESPLSAEAISTQTSIKLTKENVAFHISNINKKAKFISKRYLIKNISKNGYFLY